MHRKVSLLQRYKDIISNGLFLFGLRNRLAKLGFDIEPYYWVREEATPCEEPKIKDDKSKYSIRLLNVDEFLLLDVLQSPEESETMINGLKNGQLCVGLECDGEIAAFTFAELNSFEYKGRTFELQPNEAYLLNMWTFHKHRGKGLAPYLRWETYRLLDERGKNVKYSITNYFNKSSIKFKNKLNTENILLYLNILLFKKYNWNFTLKKYNA